MQNLNNQIADFLLCAMLGIPIGVLHDILFAKRILKRKIREILFSIFCLLSTFIIILALYFINYYELKWYTFLAIFLGLYMYKKSISNFIKAFLLFLFKIFHFKV